MPPGQGSPIQGLSLTGNVARTFPIEKVYKMKEKWFTFREAVKVRTHTYSTHIQHTRHTTHTCTRHTHTTHKHTHNTHSHTYTHAYLHPHHIRLPA